jgi:F0F1-type ATP synthase assembly protein I
MAKLVLPAIRKQAYLSVMWPLGIVSIVSLAACVFSTLLSYSMLLGGIIWFLPQGYVAIKMFHSIETQPKRFIALFYKSETIKLLFIALLFILVVKWFSVSMAGLVAGYLCAQMFFWGYYFLGSFHE